MHILTPGVGLALPHGLRRAAVRLGQVERRRAVRHRPVRGGVRQVHVPQHLEVRDQGDDPEDPADAEREPTDERRARHGPGLVQPLGGDVVQHVVDSVGVTAGVKVANDDRR